MGKTNIKYGLERKIAQALGELEAAQKEISQIQAGLKRLIALREKVREQQLLLNAAQTILKIEEPNWSGDHIKPMRKGAWSSPFPAGDLGMTALAVLREAGEWLRAREIAERMLHKIGHDPEDKDVLDRTANSVTTYLKKYEGELVESRRDYPKEWRVIR